MSIEPHNSTEHETTDEILIDRRRDRPRPGDRWPTHRAKARGRRLRARRNRATAGDTRPWWERIP